MKLTIKCLQTDANLYYIYGFEQKLMFYCMLFFVCQVYFIDDDYPDIVVFV